MDIRWNHTSFVHLVLAKDSSSKTVAWKARKTPQAAESPTKKFTHILCFLRPQPISPGRQAPSTMWMACTLLKLGLNHVEIVNYTWSINTWTTKLHAVFIYQAFLAFLSQGFLHGVYPCWTSASSERNYFTPAPRVPRPGWKLWRECLGLPWELYRTAWHNDRLPSCACSVVITNFAASCCCMFHRFSL